MKTNGNDGKRKQPRTLEGDGGTGGTGTGGTTTGGGDGGSGPWAEIDTEIRQAIQEIHQMATHLMDLFMRRSSALGTGVTDASLAGLWYEDMYKLARTAADAYAYAPQLFAGSPYDSVKLRTQEEHVRQTGELDTFLATFSAQLHGAYNAERRLLCDWTYGITNQVLGLETLPFVPPELKALVKDVAPLIHKILDARQQGKTDTKVAKGQAKSKANERVAELEAQLASKDQEIAVLRGGSVTPQKAPPPKKGRRPKKKK